MCVCVCVVWLFALSALAHARLTVAFLLSLRGCFALHCNAGSYYRLVVDMEMNRNSLLLAIAVVCLCVSMHVLYVYLVDCLLTCICI